MRAVVSLPVLCLAVAGALGAGACRRATSAGTDALSPHQVALFLDDAPVRTVELTAGAPTPLASVLGDGARDPDAWVHLEARGSGGRLFSVRGPTLRYPDSETRVYLDEDGAPSLGIFRQPRGGRAARVEPIAGLRKIASVHVFTVAAVRPTVAAAPASIPMQVDDGTIAPLDAAALARVPTTTDPRGREGGWTLGDLASARVGGAPIRAVELVGSDGSILRFDASDLTGDPMLLVKVNKEGALRVQEWPRGVGAPEQHPARVHKDLAHVRVTTAR